MVYSVVYLDKIPKSERKRLSIFDPEIPNQPVQNIYNPGTRGVTTGKTRESGTDLYVQVQIGINEKKWLAFDELELTVSTGDDIEDLLGNLRLGKKNDIARLLTFHKIDSNLSNVFYSMQASRTDFYAHQFMPVYKFIESLNGRILIADEVGLGKTIEAGLIWLEIKARKPDARRLLVICPPMLREKWKKELRMRFNTKAEIYDSRGFIDLLADFRREGQGFQCAAVCSLNSIRQDSVRNSLEEFESANMSFDLTIIDESHHLRNVSTKSHKVGKQISDLTDSLLMLSATPIHLKDEDLFRQLNILDPEEFDNFTLVQRRLIENEPIILAQSYLKKHPPQISDALEQMNRLKDYEQFSNSQLLKLIENQLRDLDQADRRGWVEIGRRLERLNLFSSAISRTRKREVQENRVERTAQTIKVRFSDKELEFYNNITEAVQKRLENSYPNAIAGFALMMPQRMMASSIPAMVEHYTGGSTWDEEVFDEIGFSGEYDEQEAQSNDLWTGLNQVVTDWNLNNIDTKFDELLRAIRNRFQNEPDVKIIIFSFFKKTLAYLNRRLIAEGLNPLVIHGDVPMDERQERINAFRNNRENQILLSSEVGSEGIDLQFCRIIINYDLPWNPMKVEQRIGRIDRLGQKAEKITIINLSVLNTIEDKILERLFNRIGIFERSLGDLEQILGDVTEKLHTELLSHRLSPKETDKRIEDTQRAIENRLQMENKLVEQSSVFVGASEYILHQIGQAREQGRWITPNDLKSFIQDFFENNFIGTTVKWDQPNVGFVSIQLTNDATNNLRNFCVSQDPQIDTDLMYAVNKPLVYDPEKSQYNEQFELLNHFHPLVKWIAETHRDNENAFFPTSSVELKTDLFPSGIYLVAIQFWNFEGFQKKIQIEYAVSTLTEQNFIEADNAELLIQEILRFGRNWEYAGQMIEKEVLMNSWKSSIDKLNQRYQKSFEEFQQENEEIKSRRQHHLEAFSVRKQEQSIKAIETLQQKLILAEDHEKKRIESQIKGRNTTIQNLQMTLKNSLDEIENKSRVQKDFKDIAAVVCRVTN